MSVHSPPLIAGVTVLAALLSALPTPAEPLQASVVLDSTDLSINHLHIATGSDESPATFAYEAQGLTLPNRIELRIDADLVHSPVAMPPGWQIQSLRLNEPDGPVRVVTYYFAGTDGLDDAEFFDFTDRWQASFRIVNPASGSLAGAPLTSAISVRVHASLLLPGFGVIPASTAHSLGVAIDSVATRQKFTLSAEGTDATGPTLRFHSVLPYILYRVESSEDLQLWTNRTELTTGSILSNHLVALEGWKVREFFRVLLIPLVPPS